MLKRGMYALILFLILPIALGDMTRHEVIADNSIIDYDAEHDYNMGSVSSMRMKTFQHHVIVKFDTSGLVGKRITDAAIYFYEPNSDDLEHVTVSTVQGDWNEGTSTGFAISQGGSCFHYASYPSGDWAWPGSKFPDVVYGNSFSLLNTAYIEKGSDSTGSYYRIDIDPELIAANVVGASYGLTFFESSGNYNVNRVVYSRESSQKPYLMIDSVEADVIPGQITGIAATDAGLDRGELKLSWTIPQDAFAYKIMVQGPGFSGELPRYMIPFAGTQGQREDVLVRDILTPGGTYTFTVEAISITGDSSGTVSVQGTASDIESLPGEDIRIGIPTPAQVPYELGALSVWVIPSTEKVLPDGSFLDGKDESYKNANPIFNGNKIFLTGARNEVVSFIAAIQTSGQPISDMYIGPSLEPGLDARIYRIGYINTIEGLMPEVLYPVSGPISTDMDENAGSEQRVQQVLIELLIPKDMDPGDYEYPLLVLWEGDIGIFEIPIELHVWDFEIPDKPGFKLEMNSYGLPSYLATYNELQRVAWQDRAHVNLLPYGQTGRTQMDLMLASGSRMDEDEYNDIQPGETTGNWDDFVLGFDDILSGNLFTEGLWQQTPVSGFYLTFHDSWPLRHESYYEPGGKDAYSAFSEHPEYSETFIDILKDFVDLAKDNSWGAGFQVYLNNKKQYGYSKWDFDEPFDYWDFLALSYFADLFDAGTVDKGLVDIKFRVDISRPEYQRNLLKDKVDLHVIGKSFLEYPRIIADNAKREGYEYWNYGTANEVYRSNMNEVGWPLLAYAYGATGIVPWSTVRYGTSYLSGVTSGDNQKLALYIVAQDSSTPEVYSTLRMKAFMRGAQDVEYVKAVKETLGLSDGQVRRLILDSLGDSVSLDTSGDYVEDAGIICLDGLSEEDLFMLRTRAALLIEGKDSFSFDDSYCVDMQALNNAIGQWKNNNSVSMRNLIGMIKAWKAGCDE